MTRFLAILAAAGLLTACAAQAPAPEPRIATHEVTIAVPTPCSADPGPDPAWPDTEAALAAETDIYDGVRLLKIGRLMRDQRIAELKAALMGCATP